MHSICTCIVCGISRREERELTCEAWKVVRYAVIEQYAHVRTIYRRGPPEGIEREEVVERNKERNDVKRTRRPAKKAFPAAASRKK